MTSSDGHAEPPNRLERRKQRTRTALVKAAQRLIAEGKFNAPVLEITQAADVGMGSFYNHFDSKEQLFAAAVADVLDTHGALLDRLTASIDDPAETFAVSFRLTGRLFRQRELETDILLATGTDLLSSDHGLAPRALRDIKAAADAGRFRVGDPELALATAGVRCWGWAPCCARIRIVTMRWLPTWSPRGCCVCSDSMPRRRAPFANARFLPSMAGRNRVRLPDTRVPVWVPAGAGNRCRRRVSDDQPRCLAAGFACQWTTK
ncbi:bacterial regulatory s, tetR family protein [Mycobacterium kansasii 732]|nr:bacterial regulatory s, tetR family protein [Mycobacterium kansasii 732]